MQFFGRLQIEREEKTKAEIQKRISKLQDDLTQINERLSAKLATRQEFDQTIQETESAYMKVRHS